jgi:cell division septum initiation protein DivIVA
MDKNFLSEVIEVEKEIQRRCDLEKVKSREWLEQARKEFEAGYALEEQSIAESLEQSVEEAKRTAESRASDIVKEAAQTAERLAMLKSETLSRIVEKHIRRIQPV